MRSDIRECPVAIVVVENVLAPVGHEEVVVAVIIVVPDANPLRPSVPDQARPRRNVRKSAVAVVAKKVVSGLLSLREPLESRAGKEKDVEPAIVVVVKKGHPAAVRLQNITLCLFSTIVVANVQSRLFRNINEGIT